MNSLLSSLPSLLPFAYAWAEKHEKIWLETGVPLDHDQMADARRAGVREPERIRVVHTEALPQLESEEMTFIATRMGLFTPRSVGLTVGYGICLLHRFSNDRPVLVHEFVHVGQYERLGGVRPFLDQYLRECIDPGYPFGRLEQEGILVARDICKGSAAGAGS